MNKSEFYNDYKKVRDKVWDILYKYKINVLPINVHSVCKLMGIEIYSYAVGQEIIKDYKLEEWTVNEGFSTIINNNYVIFYDDTIIPIPRKKFTVAHEIGHIVLGHLLENNVACRNSVTVWNHGELQEQNELESLSNIFASRLLAPAYVLKELGVGSVIELQSITGLSYKASEIRFKRLQVLAKRGKFELHPNEIKIKKQFRKFISNYKTKNK